jgi:hypothetical protein
MVSSVAANARGSTGNGGGSAARLRRRFLGSGCTGARSADARRLSSAWHAAKLSKPGSITPVLGLRADLTNRSGRNRMLESNSNCPVVKFAHLMSPPISESATTAVVTLHNLEKHLIRRPLIEISVSAFVFKMNLLQRLMILGASKLAIMVCGMSTFYRTLKSTRFGSRLLGLPFHPKLVLNLRVQTYRMRRTSAAPANSAKGNRRHCDAAHGARGSCGLVLADVVVVGNCVVPEGA